MADKKKEVKKEAIKIPDNLKHYLERPSWNEARLIKYIKSLEALEE
jgi:hypothetical protein